jgi:hypothetical protein
MESLSGDAAMHMTQRHEDLFITNSFRASSVIFVSELLVNATFVLSSRGCKRARLL